VDFEEYVVQRTQPLLRLAYVLTGDRHAAEDVTQVALLSAYRSWRSVQAAGDPEAYVRRILVNAVTDRGRRRSTGEVPVDAVPVASRAPDPADGVAARDELRRALAGLGERSRTVLVLRYYGDLDDAAIAAALGIAESTVRSTAARALASLRAGGAVDRLEEGA
jgi:RNA polymerase sigma-70 factor (sigma-E family)